MKNKLIPPCAYQGGKQRIAKDIVDIIYKNFDINEDTKFYDLCCGSGAVSIEMVNRGFYDFNITMVDASPWGLFYKGLGDLTFSPDVFKMYIDDIPKDITKIKEYVQDMLKRPANDGILENMVYKFLILQSCAFGSTATWVENNEWRKAGGLRNYWLPTKTSNRKSPVNPMMPMPDTLFERVESLCANMDGVKGIYDLIENVEIEDDENTIIYIDPPYDETCKYGYNFDYMNFVSKFKKAKIFLSEGKQLFDNAIRISGERKKGGINGDRKSKNEEWLNIIN